VCEQNLREWHSEDRLKWGKLLLARQVHSKSSAVSLWRGSAFNNQKSQQEK